MTHAHNQHYWEQLRNTIAFRNKAFINGKYCSSVSGETFDCISPIDGSLLTPVANCDEVDVNNAVKSARAAFDAGNWSELSPTDRKKLLFLFAEMLEKNSEELALLETLDMGKPIGDSSRIDIPAAIRCLRWHAEAIDKVYGEIAPTGPSELGLITREPLGVIAAIVPWNFPLLMATWKIAPALATGNCIILKPSEKSPLSALRLAELAAEAGIPKGVLNVIPGDGPSAGEPLARHPDVDGLVFTGSTQTGKRLIALAGQSNMKRTYVECGGKSPNIIFADAPDLDAAAESAAASIFFNQGEVCTAASRLLIESTIKEAFIEKVMTSSANMHPGHPLDPSSFMGAIVDSTQLGKILNSISSGEKHGAKLCTGGKQVMHESGGFYMAPTIFDNVTNDMPIAKNEVFGPVLSCISFDTEEQALSLANGSIYGLAAAVWTKDISRAHQFSRKLRAGSVWVNCWDGGDMTAPFGGYKQSGTGRDKSLHALDKYTELKATWIKL